jgi:hypothetical protein
LRGARFNTSRTVPGLVPVLVPPATPITITITITIIGPAVAVAIVGSVVVIAIAVIVTAIMSPGVSVVVGNLFDRRVRDSGTIQRERGHGGVGWAGTRKQSDAQ